MSDTTKKITSEPTLSKLSLHVMGIQEGETWEVQQKHERLMLHLESTPFGIIEWDRKLCITSLSERAKEIIGWSLMDFQPGVKNGLSVVVKQDHPLLKATGMDLLFGKVSSNNVKFRIQLPDGSIKWCEAFNTVVKHHKGKVTEIMTIIRNITHLKNLLQEFEKMLMFSDGILNSQRANITVLDGLGTIVSVNEAWTKFAKDNGNVSKNSTGLGANYLSICQKAALEGWPGADAVLKGIRSVMDGISEEFYLEYPCNSPTEERWYGMRVCKFESDSPMVVVSHKNITQRMIGEKDLRRNEAELKAAQALAHLGSFEVNLINGNISWSDELFNLLGLVREEVQPSNELFLSMIHPYDVDQPDESLKNVFATFQNNSDRFRLILQDGSIKYVFCEWKFEVGPDGLPLSIHGIVQDVSDLERAHQDLKKNLEELEQRVESRTHDLTNQNKDILDSIFYAKRIQLGLLSPNSELTKIFPNSFIFSHPRDIISGDFFWVHERQGKKFIVVADCTGHGVPGALMSLIGNNLLNQIIIEEQNENPSEILKELDMRLKASMRGDHAEVKDGMDLVLCIVDSTFYELYFAGAYRPLFITDEQGKISEILPDRKTIGGGADEQPKHFVTKRTVIIPGQRIYLTSDGYYSQFGGPQEKKFMKSKFISTLESMQQESMPRQEILLQEILKTWKGKNDQVDDVLVVGIEL